VRRRPDFSILRVRLAQGQQIFAEPSVMATMDPTLDLRAGLKGALLGSMGRAIAGESLVLNTFTVERGPGELMLAPGGAGDVVHHRVRGASLMLQRGAYVAHTEGVELNAKWGGARGFFSGQGLPSLSLGSKVRCSLKTSVTSAESTASSMERVVGSLCSHL
jgi:uncharacterized protein (TIGR00266 family)